MIVSIYSREAIEEIIRRGDFPENTAVISYYDPELNHIDKKYSHVDYSNVCDNVFYCELDDLDLDYMPEKGYTYETFFPDVDDLAEFIYEAYQNGKDIICQCEYGQSRSAATAAAIKEFFYHNGIDIFTDYRYYPNQVVYHKVFNALGNLKTQIETAKDYEAAESNADKEPVILNLHGYNGTPENSAYSALKANGYNNITAPEIDYEAESPEELLERLRGIIAEKKPDVLVGTSLGGFFASVLSAEFHLPVILVNPFLQPFLTFPEYINGYIKVFGTISEINKEQVCCIVGEDDELLGDHQFTKDLFDNSYFRSVPGGKHSGATLPLKEYFSDIIESLLK